MDETNQVGDFLPEERPLFPPKFEAYLLKLAAGARKFEAAEEVGLTMSFVRLFRSRRPDFREAEDESCGRFGDFLERKAVERGVEGWEEVTTETEKGVVVSEKRVRKYDHSLLLAALRARNPAYRERAQLDVSLAAGVMVVGAPARTAEEWEKMAKDASTR